MFIIYLFFYLLFVAISYMLFRYVARYDEKHKVFKNSSPDKWAVSWYEHRVGRKRIYLILTLIPTINILSAVFLTILVRVQNDKVMDKLF